jgi:hypothetical protein
MKIKKSQLVQIIKEELSRHKAIQALEKRKTDIQHQLNEMYSMEEELDTMPEIEMEEGLGDAIRKGGRFLGLGEPMPEEIAHMEQWIDTDPKAFRARERYQHDAETFHIDPSETKNLLAKFFAKEGGPVGTGYNFDPLKKQYFKTSKTANAALRP